MKTGVRVVLLGWAVCGVASYADEIHLVTPEVSQFAETKTIKRSNRGHLRSLVQAAVDQGHEIVVLPSNTISGYMAETSRKYYDGKVWCRPGKSEKVSADPIGGYSYECEDVTKVAERVPEGPSTRIFSEMAQENSIYILFHIPEKAVGEWGYYSTLVVVGPEGYVTKHRKARLFSADAYAAPGTDGTILKIGDWTYGLMLGKDAHYDHSRNGAINLFELYKSEGVDRILVSSHGAYLPYIANYSEKYQLPIFIADIDFAAICEPSAAGESGDSEEETCRKLE